MSIHEMSLSDGRMKAGVARIVRHNRPHGLIWLRLTPDWASREYAWSKKLPIVIVHGDRLGDYTRPVIGHVVPSQKPIRQAIKQWARDLRVPRGSRTIVVATMQRELSPSSIRNERIDLITAGIREAGSTAIEFLVPDYSASNAMAILEAHPSAAAYVCLSDEIAIAVKQMLVLKGRKDAGRVVLGFDDSPLAARYGIWSFSQHLDEIGNRVQELLVTFFKQRAANSATWPDFQEVKVEVNLTPRE
jgi:DNA-binding LacI/PurR family transcriptional regulator